MIFWQPENKNSAKRIAFCSSDLLITIGRRKVRMTKDRIRTEAITRK